MHTTRIKVGTLVTNVGLRNPSLLSKMSSTLDNISNGRLILGLGTGDMLSRKELYSYGYPLPDLNERIDRLRECILILKSMWTGEESTFTGKHYQISGAVNFPKPKQHPHPPIWVGGRDLRILDVVAEHGDGWNYWGLNTEGVNRRNEYLRRMCAKYRRQADSILKSWSGTFRQLRRGNVSRSETVQNMTGTLKRLVGRETTYFIASFDSHADPQSYEAFADAVKSFS